MHKLLRWLDEHILFIWAGFLLAFIPLWPKIPLFSPIEQYIVRVRLEDFLLLIGGGIWLWQAWRRKITWTSPMFWPVALYALAGLISIVCAIFWFETVPFLPLHVGKTVLHYFRYLEYFAFFFIVFSSIKRRSQAVAMVGILVATVFAIAIYGYGQRYFYWPVYSTMNREFSKGIRLYLTQYARVQSTFGGHYDMAAFLVLVLPIILSLAYKNTKVWLKTLLHFTFLLGTWLLILSASRTPFVAYLAGIGVVLLISAWLQPLWLSKFKFLFSRGLLLLLSIVILFYYFGQDLSERLSHIFDSSTAVTSLTNQFTQLRRFVISDQQLALLPLTPEQLQAILPKSAPPSNGISTDDIAAAVAAAKEVASLSDLPPMPFGGNAKASPKPKLRVNPSDNSPIPQDVYENIPDEIEVSTISATGVVEKKIVKRPRVYSDCALKKELSLCIRLETLWPRALEGFLISPLTGTGYATLTKEAVDQFTEADSTDNNFLRILGEIGLLGYLAFFSAVATVMWFAITNLKNKDEFVAALSLGVLAGSISLLLNAIYIDVFAASKVALTYWGIAGLLIATTLLEDKKQLVTTHHKAQVSRAVKK